MNQTNTNMNQKAPIAGVLQTISPKMMVMAVLVAVMGILWGRVLLRGKSGPQTAVAGEMTGVQQGSLATAVSGGIRIEPVELPCRAGRNDRLSKDVFSGANWTAFTLEQTDGKSGLVTAAGSPAQSPDQSRLERMAAKMTLEAIIKAEDGTPYQAFVNGKILTVGSTLTVKEGPDQFVLTVTDIKAKEVEFSWNTVSAVLKMAETNNE